MTITPKLPTPPPPLPVLGLWRRLRLWLSMLFIDHSLFRVWINTPKRVGADLWRSSHPMPFQLRAMQRAGMGSVINLRGCDDTIASNLLERDECTRIGLPLEHYTLFSRQAPTKEDVLGFDRLLDQLPKPILVHCKSGADRAGLASSLYLLLRENATPEQALQQLCFWPHGHIKQARTGLLDHFLEAYRDHHRAHGTPFRDWVINHFDRDAVTNSFESKGWANRLVDGLLKRE